MARENRRKREERRFGRPERLADVILGASVRDLGLPVYARDATWVTELPKFLETYRELIARSTVIDASNVAEYYYSHCEKSNWDVVEDFPNCRPPFDLLFLEFRRPTVFRDESGCQPFDPSFPDAWGFIVQTLPADGLPRSCGNESIDRELVSMLDLPGVSLIVRMVLIVRQRGLLVPGMTSFYLPIDELGRVVGCHKYLTLTGPGDSVDLASRSGEEKGQFAHTAYLTFSFLHCKNVSLTAVDSDRAINRERRKHGHKPFVRYHTINIEPMKRVLKTEGQVETQGLKRALHICRGHFAHYTEERPLFGRVAGTFWVPAHVRGTTKEGMVISDYKVSASRTGIQP